MNVGGDFALVRSYGSRGTYHVAPLGENRDGWTHVLTAFSHGGSVDYQVMLKGIGAVQVECLVFEEVGYKRAT